MLEKINSAIPKDSLSKKHKKTVKKGGKRLTVFNRVKRKTLKKKR